MKHVVNHDIKFCSTLTTLLGYTSELSIVLVGIFSHPFDVPIQVSMHGLTTVSYYYKQSKLEPEKARDEVSTCV